jgi:hypothetical protein
MLNNLKFLNARAADSKFEHVSYGPELACLGIAGSLGIIVIPCGLDPKMPSLQEP